MSRIVAVLALALVAGSTLLGGQFSGATFTDVSASTATVRAATDWTPPTVSVRQPAGTLKDTVTLTADAADGETGIGSVTIQFLPANGSWTSLCTATTTPYSCPWNTKTVTDGSYDLRARATDHAGYTAVSAIVSTTVANSLLVVLASPGEVVHGTVTLSAQVHNPGLLTWSVRIEYAAAGSGSWKPVCTSLATPYTCSWATTSLANQEYDLRAVAVSGLSTYTSASIANVLVDNLAPSVAVVAPASPARGTVTLAATAADAHSGVAEVRLQYAAAGGSTWTTACVLHADPFSCPFDTTRIPDGGYSLRAVATDTAGNATTSAAVAWTVDNTVSSVSLEDPGAFLSGTLTLRANAASTSGVTSLRIQSTPSGSSAWTDACTVTVAPYTCAWTTTTVADGPYDLRAVLVDGHGAVTTSTVVAGRTVDNSPLRAYDVQTVGGAGTTGRLDQGDAIVLTYTDQVAPGTVSPGWTGAALAVTVRVRDGNLLGQNAKADVLDVLRGGATVHLGQVGLREDFVRSNKTVQFTATMTAGTTTVAGLTVSTVTLVLGTPSGTSALRTVSTAPTLVWTPSASATDLTGRPCSAAPATERGTADKDF